MRKLLFRLALFAAFLATVTFLIAREGNGYAPQETAEAGEHWEEYAQTPAEAAGEPEEIDGLAGDYEPFAGEIPAIRWYRSNAAGMALEFTPSRLVAMRSEYSLSVEAAAPEEIPAILLPYFDSSYRIELRTLFQGSAEARRQWIFRDSRGFAMLVASGSAYFFGGDGQEDERRTGFIEFRNSEGSVVRERLFEEDLSQWEFRFFYTGNILQSSQAWFKPAPAPVPVPASPPEYEYPYEYAGTIEAPPEPEIPELALLFTHFYRYARSGALRAIDRVFHGAAEENADRIAFPRTGPAMASAREAGNVPIFYTPGFILSAIRIAEGARVSYTLDNRGRIVSEVWTDEDGRIVGEFRNTWLNDRLAAVLWRSDDGEWRVEYEYNAAGDRVVERNFRQGVLERTVTRQEDGRDMEELFMNERLMLRAIWEDGLKISEERISQIGMGVVR
ncbi:MAG: hypothetical protein FWC64_12275 [Treponema sp.]|nr:hypothetical protein [Treponema sp.]